jgi:hypothetical protein
MQWGIPARWGIGLNGNCCAREKVDRLFIEVFQECDMEGIENASISCVPESVGLRVQGITNQNAGA